MSKKKISLLILALVLILYTMLFVSCASFQVKQYGIQEMDTIAINLTRDPNIAPVLITHVNGEATGAEFSHGFLGIGGKTVFVNPLYVKLTGKPIVLTVKCQVAVQTVTGMQLVYKTTELRLTKLADVKRGDVFTLRWMFQTQTFAFIDATGNIVEQVIPTFY